MFSHPIALMSSSTLFLHFSLIDCSILGRSIPPFLITHAALLYFKTPSLDCCLFELPSVLSLAEFSNVSLVWLVLLPLAFCYLYCSSWYHRGSDHQVVSMDLDSRVSRLKPFISSLHTWGTEFFLSSSSQWASKKSLLLLQPCLCSSRTRDPPRGGLQLPGFLSCVLEISFIAAGLSLKASQTYLFGFKCFPDFWLQGSSSLCWKTWTRKWFYYFTFKISKAGASKMYFIPELKGPLVPFWPPPTQYKHSTKWALFLAALII